MTRWAILTGEYPPDPGGVSDYTRLVAEALALAGDEVQVFVSPLRETATPGFTNLGVMVHRLSGRFGPRSLAQLECLLARRPRPDRVLLQYVPHAFGYKAMNVPFAAWVALRLPRIAPVWVMFHEVAFPLRRRPPSHGLLALVNRVMARFVASAAERVFVSIPAWVPLLKEIAPRTKQPEWMPVPCSVGSERDMAAIASVRKQLEFVGPLIGHFGTFGTVIVELLEPAIVELLRLVPSASMICIGRGSDVFRDHFSLAHPELAKRICATGRLSSAAVSAHLRACDLVIQPFPDGISSRRTSTMAALANGVATVSNLGPLSEPLWACGSLVVAPTPDPVGMARQAAELLGDPVRLAQLGPRGAAFYHERFALERTISRLRGAGR